MDRRTPMTAGIAFAVLYAVALVLTPRFPGIDKPGSAIVAHVNEHSAEMRAQALLLAFGSLALVVLLGYARERLAVPASYVFTIGAAALLVQVFIATWFTAGLALHPEQLGSGTARTITDVVTMWGPMLTVTNLMMAVPILLAANAGQFPRWLGIVAAVFAVEQLIETITIIGPPGSFISPGGPMNTYLGAPLFILFFLALGVALSLQQQRDNRPAIVDVDDPVDDPDRVGEPQTGDGDIVRPVTVEDSAN
ncbi:hypothetical protein [Mycolicibacterium tusciae]|uniref:DUF4386 domain-containing protein n=1 Tax=Mycolicibacterium tusciae TaxID=75922 RepID=A0A1X0JTN7_9MYCO|nr:hypothetical protein [Mycolicibacterium tusciae]ORB66080.1 hypothetical protein BST47_09325 [Mycolicibacterium tusciae]